MFAKICSQKPESVKGLFDFSISFVLSHIHPCKSKFSCLFSLVLLCSPSPSLQHLATISTSLLYAFFLLPLPTASSSLFHRSCVQTYSSALSRWHSHFPRHSTSKAGGDTRGRAEHLQYHGGVWPKTEKHFDITEITRRRAQATGTFKQTFEKQHFTRYVIFV